MAPTFDWNPNGNNVFDNNIFHMRQMSGPIHVRNKRGGRGGPRQRNIPNTSAMPGNLIFINCI